MDDSRRDDTPDTTQKDADVTERQKDFTRRALIQAGWVVPLVTAVNIPSAYAQSPPPHSDHSDVPHQDAHIDSHTDVHSDVPAPHSDAPHVDSTVRR